MELLKLTINGNQHQVLINEFETLTDVIRNRIGLTGTKVGCEQGSCGTCTVLLNNIPVLSCITLAIKCQYANIYTIEGVSEHPKWSKLQAKFVEHGAVQCGYCTPGMIMTSIGLLSKKTNPSREEIKEALSGNLCRCTGYKKIIDAVESFFTELNVKNTSYVKNNNYKVIGLARPNIEAESKANGSIDYADDIQYKNVLHCKLLRSPYAHAIIENIDCTEALNLAGVKAITIGKDLPEKFGVLPVSNDETAMAVDKVRYVGEIVAAVAAESEEIAINACRLIKVTYKPIKAFYTIEDSLKEINISEKIHAHGRYTNNIHKKAELRFGNQKEGLENSDARCKMIFDFAGINHGFTEPHSATAFYDENGLTIISATQVPHYLHRAIAKVLHEPHSRIRVIKPAVGGGFGGKSDPFPHEIIVSYLAKITKRKVKISFSREEVFINNHGRHPAKIEMEVGVSKDGMLQAIDANIVIDGGAYGSFGVVTTYYSGSLLQGPYLINNLGYESTRVYTNKPQCGAMRGHGGVNPRFAMESILDELAFKLNLDPCEMRLKNLLPENTITVGQLRITSNGSYQGLQKVMEQAGWKNKFRKLPYGHGIGVACSWYISGSNLPIIWNNAPQSVVHLKVDFDGRVVIYSGASDIGQGSDTMLAIIVAETLGIDLKHIYVKSADTLLTPVDLGSYSSRVTFMAGNAAKMAAENLRKEILSAIAKQKNISESDLYIEDNLVFSCDKTISLSWIEAIDIATAGRGALTVSGHYNSPKLGGDFKGAGAGLSPAYSFVAVIVEVKVNAETGQFDVINIVGAHDCGMALNPLSVEGQLEGSWHMGLGQAISEQMTFHDGLLLNNNFLEYKIPTTLDTPDINTNIIESNDKEGPYGAKECGEGSIHPVIPAVANAIFNAVGVRITSLPITAEKVFKAIQEKYLVS